jgi:Homeodomain
LIACNESSLLVGITNKDVSDWMDSSDFDVRMTSSEVKKLTTKRLNQERCNEVLPALYEFLDELTQKESKKPSFRRHFSAEATVILEEAFRLSQSLDSETCKALAEQVGDTPERVSNWFHNR